MSGPQHILPPASTTKVNLREQAAGFFAQRRTGAAPVVPAVSEAVEEARSLLSPPAARTPVKPLDQSKQRYTLSQLVQRLQEARDRQQRVVESGDPDGPEDETGWDPRDIVPKGGASLAAGALAHQRRQ